MKTILVSLAITSQIASPALAGGCGKFFSRKIISHSVCAPEIVHQQACPQPAVNIFYPVGMVPQFGQQPLQTAQYGQLQRQFQRMEDLFAQYAPQPQSPPAYYPPPQPQPVPQPYYPPPVQQAPPQTYAYQPPPPQYAPPQRHYYQQEGVVVRQPDYLNPPQSYAPPQQYAEQPPVQYEHQPQPYYPPAQQSSPCEGEACPPEESLPVPQQAPQYPAQQPQQYPAEQYQAPAQQYPPEHYVQSAPAQVPQYGASAHHHRPGAVPPPASHLQQRGILTTACLRCHNQDRQEGGIDVSNPYVLSVEDRQALYAKAASGEMPKNGRRLTPQELIQFRFELGLVAANAAVGR